MIDVGEHDPAVAKLRRALELWRGRPLSDFEYDSFAQPEIAGCPSCAWSRSSSESRWSWRWDERDSASVRQKSDPGDQYREPSPVMLALYRSGRQAEALEAYRDARTFLIDELGLEPSTELRGLHESILAQEESLLVSSTESLDSGPAVALGWRGPRATNLPTPTASLVGRDRERAKLHELLAGSDRRIVTLTGIGGLGRPG